MAAAYPEPFRVFQWKCVMVSVYPDSFLCQNHCIDVDLPGEMKF